MSRLAIVFYSGVLGMFSIFGPSVFASIQLGPIVDPANGYSYYLLSRSKWSVAESDAVALGGTLAIVNSAAENTWIFNTFASAAAGNGNDLWIGLYDPVSTDGTGSQHSADFIWANGAIPTYTNWSAGQPNGDPGQSSAADYTAMTSFSHDGLTLGAWNDKTDDSSTVPSQAVVEVVPEPSALALVVVGGARLMVRRPRRLQHRR